MEDRIMRTFNQRTRTRYSKPGVLVKQNQIFLPDVLVKEQHPSLQMALRDPKSFSCSYSTPSLTFPLHKVQLLIPWLLPRQVLICSKAKLQLYPKYPFISIPHQQKSRIWRKCSSYFHIPGVGKTVKSRGFRVFVWEVKSHFNQHTHYVPQSWLISHPSQLQGE